MDYLDPRKQFRHRIILLVGYVFIAVAIVIGTMVLLYQAYGFSIGKNGTVIQSGLIFFSSQPHPANIYINGALNGAQTNTRLELPAGIYHFELKSNGYRNWTRTIELDGGKVEHFDYPFLFPTLLTNKTIQSYASSPEIMTQSPDRRWLMVEEPITLTDFKVFDLTNPAKAPVDIALPAGIATKAQTNESWQLGEWADDNQHILVQHIYDGKSEFILINRTDPSHAVNLNTALAASPSQLTLNNKKYDQYYLYNAANHELTSASLSAPAPTPVLQQVLAYQSYGSDGLLYATGNGAPSGKTLIKLAIGGQTYNVRNFPAGASYLLDLTQYNGTLYVAVGANTDNRVYIYKDPVGQLNAQPNHALVPIQVLHTTSPNYLSFSSNAQFIMTENNGQFSVYDIENAKGYIFSKSNSLDAPQAHASWMDGDRLMYVSGGKLTVFDYDGTNQQTLTSASSGYLPAFSPDYHFLYALAPATVPSQMDLVQVPLLSTGGP